MEQLFVFFKKFVVSYTDLDIPPRLPSRYAPTRDTHYCGASCAGVPNKGRSWNVMYF